MRYILATIFLALASPSAAGCPLLQPSCHGAVTPSLAIRKLNSLAHSSKTHSALLALHIRHLDQHDKQFAAMAASLAAVRRELADLRGKLK